MFTYYHASLILFSSQNLVMDAPSCIVCGKEAHRLCSACKTTHYCCKDHQVAHWKVHKSSCCGKTYRMEGNANSGHYLVAQKDLTAGIVLSFTNYFYAYNVTS